MNYFPFLNNFLVTNKRIVKGFVFVALALGALALLNNRLQNRIAIPFVDDLLTINNGINSMYSGKVYDLKVGESTRWLARMVYPIGLYYMNSNMGGEHYVTGWDYPSGNYVQKHFHEQSDIPGDPNIQDLVFAMKFVLGALVILSFLFAAYFLNKRYGFIAGLAYFSFALSSLLVNDMLWFFYTESTLVILFNLILVFALNSNINTLRLYIWMAFIFAFSLSTKLTGIVFLIPILMILKRKEGKDWIKGLRVEAFILLILVFLGLIHIHVSSFMSLLDQTLANVYHYKTGHLHTVPSGMYQFREIMKTIPVWICLFPLAIVFLLFSKVENKSVILAIALSVFIILESSLDMSVFLERNLTTPLVIIIFLVSISLSLLIDRINFKSIKIISMAVCVLFFGCSCINYYKPINEKSVSNYSDKYKSIALIDVSKEYFPNATVLKSMPDDFTLQDQLPEFIHQFLPYECVIVKRVKNNKHYTNYILPLGYDLVERIGNYFVFQQKKQLKAHLDKIKELEKCTAISESKIKIYHIKNNLVLYKSNCAEQDLNHRFFVHIYPVNVADLLPDKVQYGFNNNDFDFPKEALINAEFYLNIPLPDYPIKSIEIGQFNNDITFWNQFIFF